MTWRATASLLVFIFGALAIIAAIIATERGERVNQERGERVMILDQITAHGHTPDWTPEHLEMIARNYSLADVAVSVIAIPHTPYLRVHVLADDPAKASAAAEKLVTAMIAATKRRTAEMCRTNVSCHVSRLVVESPGSPGLVVP